MTSPLALIALVGELVLLQDIDQVGEVGHVATGVVLGRAEVVARTHEQAAPLATTMDRRHGFVVRLSARFRPLLLH